MNSQGRDLRVPAHRRGPTHPAAEPGNAELPVPPVTAFVPTPAATLENPEHFVVKKITTGGTFRFQHRLLCLANAMVDQHIGLEETDDGVWNNFFNTALLATLDEKDYIIRG